MATSLKTQLRVTKEALRVPLSELDRTAIVPILTPAEFFASGYWSGPSVKLRSKKIGLTWTVLMPNLTMRYVSYEMQEKWKSEGLDWKDRAMRNLTQRTEGHTGTFELKRPNGELYAVSFMHPDGLGPSRLLFRRSLDRMFPSGFLAAIPERSCGFAYSFKATESERKQVEDLIADCYRKGPQPFLPESFDPDELLPE